MSQTVHINNFEECLKNYGGIIQFMEQDEDLCWLAIKANGENIQYVKNPTEEMIICAIENSMEVPDICFNNQTDEIKEALIRANCFVAVENPTEEQCIKAIKQHADNIRYIKNPSEEMCMLAVQESPLSIGEISNPSEIVRLAAVTLDGFALSRFSEQTEEMCLIAVKNNCRSRLFVPILRYAKHQTLEVCMAAIKNDPRSIDYIKDPDMKNECLKMLGR